MSDLTNEPPCRCCPEYESGAGIHGAECLQHDRELCECSDCENWRAARRSSDAARRHNERWSSSEALDSTLDIFERLGAEVVHRPKREAGTFAEYESAMHEETIRIGRELMSEPEASAAVLTRWPLRQLRELREVHAYRLHQIDTELRRRGETSR